MATLRFSKGRIVDLAHTPNEEGIKSVLVLEGKLTYAIACNLMCEGMFFGNKEMPRPFSGSIGLAKGIKDAEIALPTPKDAWNVLKCDIPKLRAYHAENVDDEELRMELRAHFDGNHEDLLMFVLDKRKAEIKFEVRKRQGSLFEEDEEEEAVAGSTVVDGKKAAATA